MDMRKAIMLVESGGRENDREEYFRIKRDLEARYDRDEDDFDVISHREQRHSKERPLVIIIHPGDAIEPNVGWGDQAAYKRVRKFSRTNQAGMARELSDWRRTHDADIAVLHRESSCELVPGEDCDDEYELEVTDAHSRGSVVFGDDLQKAADWMIANLHIADRPHIFLTGAYSEVDYGCLTFIGRKIEAVVGPDRISVSKFSPPGNGPAKVWRPGEKNIRFGKDR